MAYSDDNNFTTMQEEAIRRVREMQRRSRSIVGASPNSEPAPPKAEETPHTQNAHSPQKAPQSSSLLSGLLGGNFRRYKDRRGKSPYRSAYLHIIQAGRRHKASSGAWLPSSLKRPFKKCKHRSIGENIGKIAVVIYPVHVVT